MITTSFEGFFNRYRRFIKYKEIPAVLSLFEFLTSPEIIDRMIIVNDHAGLSPLDAVVESVESFDINFSGELESRQMVGAMIKFTLEPFGYSPTDRTSIRNSKKGYFKLASRYVRTNENQATMMLEKRVRITKK